MNQKDQIKMANRLSKETGHPVDEFIKYIEWWDKKNITNIEYELAMCAKRGVNRGPLWREFAEIDWCYNEPYLYNQHEVREKYYTNKSNQNERN